MKIIQILSFFLQYFTTGHYNFPTEILCTPALYFGKEYWNGLDYKMPEFFTFKFLGSRLCFVDVFIKGNASEVQLVS